MFVTYHHRDNQGKNFRRDEAPTQFFYTHNLIFCLIFEGFRYFLRAKFFQPPLITLMPITKIYQIFIYAKKRTMKSIIGTKYVGNNFLQTFIKILDPLHLQKKILLRYLICIKKKCTQILMKLFVPIYPLYVFKMDNQHTFFCIFYLIKYVL